MVVDVDEVSAATEVGVVESLQLKGAEGEEAGVKEIEELVTTAAVEVAGSAKETEAEPTADEEVEGEATEEEVREENEESAEVVNEAGDDDTATAAEVVETGEEEGGLAMREAPSAEALTGEEGAEDVTADEAGALEVAAELAEGETADEAAEDEAALDVAVKEEAEDVEDARAEDWTAYETAEEVAGLDVEEVVPQGALEDDEVTVALLTLELAGTLEEAALELLELTGTDEVENLGPLETLEVKMVVAALDDDTAEVAEEVATLAVLDETALEVAALAVLEVTTALLPKVVVVLLPQGVLVDFAVEEEVVVLLWEEHPTSEPKQFHQVQMLHVVTQALALTLPDTSQWRRSMAAASAPTAREARMAR